MENTQLLEMESTHKVLYSTSYNKKYLKEYKEYSNSKIMLEVIISSHEFLCYTQKLM
jgi:hypothetical protein